MSQQLETEAMAPKESCLVKQPRLVFYGESKIGISTFLSNCSNSLFIDTDDTLSYLSVNKFRPANYDDLIKKIKELAESKDDPTRVFIIDHLLGIERILFAHVCKIYDEGKFKCIDDFPYGKGYIYYMVELVRFFKYLNWLRNKKNMMIVIAGHSVLDEVITPLGEKYNYYKPYMIGKTHKGEDPVKLLSQWCDGLFYVGKLSTINQNPTIFFDDTLSFRAGNRLSMEGMQLLNWDEFKKNMEK